MILSTQNIDETLTDEFQNNYHNKKNIHRATFSLITHIFSIASTTREDTDRKNDVRDYYRYRDVSLNHYQRRKTDA
jgi:hypothetical protein